MKANELRIGNLITEFNIEVIDVCLLDLLDLESMADGDTHYKAILLTKEWLLKFGFENIKYNDYYLHPFTFRENKIRIGYKTSTRHLANDIKYVHQLQNLYFAIIGEELTINK